MKQTVSNDVSKDSPITRGTTSQRLGSISFSFFFMSRLAIRSSDCHIWDLSPVPRVSHIIQEIKIFATCAKTEEVCLLQCSLAFTDSGWTKTKLVILDNLLASGRLK